MGELESSDSVGYKKNVENFHAVHGKGDVEQTSIFQRIFASFIPSKQKVEVALPRKIFRHKENANEVRAQLEKVKKELLDEFDQELSPMITEVIDPMLRDISRIDRMMHKETEDTVVEEHFREWTAGATLWVELFSKIKDKERIKSEIVKHIIVKSMERIERDIRFIEGYFEHSLQQLTLSPEEIHRTRLTKTKLVLQSIQQLRSLQALPDRVIQFNEVNEWREKLDHQRANYFDAALRIIDR